MPSTQALRRSPLAARAGRIVAVGGGKGGVGKSLVASNLAVAAAQRGASVWLVDADFGAANAHTLLGIERPGPGLGALLDGSKRNLADVAIATAMPGLTLVPGAGALPGAANFTHAQKQRLLGQMRAIPADLVVIDVGAGVSFNVLDFFLLADLAVVVVTPQMTSIQNAYGFLKSAIHRLLEQLPLPQDAREAVQHESTVREAELVTAWLRRVQDVHPQAAALCQLAISAMPVRMVGNQLMDERDRHILDSVARMYRDFLGVNAELVATFKSARKVLDSVNLRRPLMLDDGPDDNSRNFRAMAAALMNENVGAIRALRSQTLAGLLQQQQGQGAVAPSVATGMSGPWSVPLASDSDDADVPRGAPLDGPPQAQGAALLKEESA
jgi:flagellar biosynthesis protein FlhG